MEGLGSLGSIACVLVCGDRSWVLWWARLCPEVAADPGFLRQLSAGRWGCVSVQLTAWPEASQYLSLQTVGLQWDFSVVISYKKNSRIVLPCRRRSSPKWFRNLCTQGEMELFPTSPGGGRSNPGYHQITASTLGRLCVNPLQVRSLFPSAFWNSQK